METKERKTTPSATSDDKRECEVARNLQKLEVSIRGLDLSGKELETTLFITIRSSKSFLQKEVEEESY